MKLLKLNVVGGLVLIALILSAGVSASTLSNNTTSQMYTIPHMDAQGNAIGEPQPIAGAYSRVRTTEEGAIAWIETSGFKQGHAVSLWWIIFNYPENCIDGCDEDDFYNNAEATGASMIGALGEVVTNPTKTRLFSIIDAYDASIADEGPGLLHPLTAEFHMVLRDHGQARSDILLDQLSTYMGGCDPEPPHLPCRDSQFAIHRQ